MKLYYLFLTLCIALVMLSCNMGTEPQGEVITVKLNPSFVSLNEGTDLPMNVKGKNVKMTVDPNQVIYAIQVYENDSAYYYGLFDKIDSMKIALTTGKSYRFKITTYKVGTGTGLKQDVQAEGKYFYLPNKTLLGNKFLKGNALKDIDLISSPKLNTAQAKDYPEIDVFYCEKTVMAINGVSNIDFNLLRMGFGVIYNVDGLTNGKLHIIMGNDTTVLNSTTTTGTSIRLFNVTTGNLSTIFKTANTYADSILIKVQWVGTNGTVLETEGKFKFIRNYQKTLNIQLNTPGLKLNFEGWGNSTVTDIDGNVYATVTIGNQTWMAENLKTTHYRDGTEIPNVTSNIIWANLTTGAWCNYNNDDTNDLKFGKLYNWYATVDSHNIAPVGWHVATDEEWITLNDYVSAHLGTSTSVGKALAACTNWNISSTIGAIGYDLTQNNTSGFNALPAGGRFNDGEFVNYGVYGGWWTATLFNSSRALYRDMYFGNNYLYGSNNSKLDGMSIRCVKD